MIRSGMEWMRDNDMKWMGAEWSVREIMIYIYIYINHTIKYIM